MPKFPTFPSLDFSALDARKLADLDDKLVSLARDAAYVSIGFGVLTVQLQVRRRDRPDAEPARRRPQGPRRGAREVGRRPLRFHRRSPDVLGAHA